MIIKIPLKPLSINKAWQGRRFKTKENKQFAKDVSVFLPKNQKIQGYVEVIYRFYLVNWKMTDGDNCVKTLQDIIVNADLIDDDRFIMRYTIEKYPSKTDWIEVHIKEFYFEMPF